MTNKGTFRLRRCTGPLGGAPCRDRRSTACARSAWRCPKRWRRRHGVIRPFGCASGSSPWRSAATGASRSGARRRPAARWCWSAPIRNGSSCPPTSAKGLGRRPARPQAGLGGGGRAGQAQLPPDRTESARDDDRMTQSKHLETRATDRTGARRARRCRGSTSTGRMHFNCKEILIMIGSLARRDAASLPEKRAPPPAIGGALPEGRRQSFEGLVCGSEPGCRGALDASRVVSTLVQSRWGAWAAPGTDRQVPTGSGPAAFLLAGQLILVSLARGRSFAPEGGASPSVIDGALLERRRR
jgi:hypothetical protein